MTGRNSIRVIDRIDLTAILTGAIVGKRLRGVELSA